MTMVVIDLPHGVTFNAQERSSSGLLSTAGEYPDTGYFGVGDCSRSLTINLKVRGRGRRGLVGRRHR